MLNAVKILACDAYESVLWQLNSSSTSAFFKAYTSCVRLIYRLPVSTFS